MWRRRSAEEAGQAAVESAALLGALAVGAWALGRPLLGLLVEAWERHRAGVDAVIELPLP